MIAQNLHFFDGQGINLNLEYDSELEILKGKVYFEPLSIYLFDNANLFVLEKDDDRFVYPMLEIGEGLEFSWESNANEDELYLYEVVEDLDLKQNFIQATKSKTVMHEDIDPSGTMSPLDISAPLQVNVAFNPTLEKAYTRKLVISRVSDMSPNVKTRVAEIEFYGEGEDEEKRFSDWAENFGIRFQRADANILKDYDIKEAMPDMVSLNRARKELLVSKENVYPYIGTYKGLANFINMMGYKDVIQVKEYWRNVNPSSHNHRLLSMVDITDYLDDGKIDGLDLSDKGRSVREGRQFKKTEFLAIVYQFTRATDEFDDDNVPIVEETTEFTVDEVFYKLNRLGEKLKNEFLPVNVKIKDIIGEFIYFQKYTISYWPDSTRIFDYRLNDLAKIAVWPGSDVNLTLRSLDPLYGMQSQGADDFGVGHINTNGAKDPFTFGQVYSRADNSLLIDNIREFYAQIRDQRIPDLGARLTWEFGDDPERQIGAPVVLSIDIPKLTVEDLDGVKLEDLDAIAPGLSPYWTLENLDYRNYYEVNWKIIKSSPNPYYFEQRGRVVDLHQIGHVLPYAGKYRVIIELYDFFGNVSVFGRFIEVSDALRPEIVAFTRVEDKFDYRLSNLSNVMLKDFGASKVYAPRCFVLDTEDSDRVNTYRNLLEWISFFHNRYGMGQNLYDLEVYNPDTNSYVSYTDPSWQHPMASYWGLGRRKHPIRLSDLENMTIESLYWLRLSDLVHLDDFNAGFYIRNPRPGGTIGVSLFSDYVLPDFSSLDELVEILNSSNHPAVRLFNYEIINGRRSDGQYIIHAQANFLGKQMYHILSLTGGESPSPSPSFSPSSPGGVSGDKYTFFLPKGVYSKSTIEFLRSISPVMDDETLFLLAKTSDILTGAVQDPSFWQENKYWSFTDDRMRGHLPTMIDQNAFTATEIKQFNQSFSVPENAIVWFVVNNLDGKNEFIWSLVDESTREEVFRAKSVPFFVWKFKDIGRYTISVKVYDNRGTEYSNTLTNAVTVLGKTQYIQYIERRLNERKARLLRDRYAS